MRPVRGLCEAGKTVRKTEPRRFLDWQRRWPNNGEVSVVDDIKLALLGNKEAAKRLTEAGVLVPCPFCGNDAVVHEVEAQPRYAEIKKEVPKGARIIRCISYPSGKEYFEYRKKEYIPQCVDSSCCGRAVKRFNTQVEAISAWNTRAPILSAKEMKELSHG